MNACHLGISLIFLLILAGPVSAQATAQFGREGLALPKALGPQPAVNGVASIADHRIVYQPLSENTALRFSLGGALVPAVPGLLMIGLGDGEAGIMLATTGFVIGPATGYFYARQTDRGLFGIGIRTATAAVVLIAMNKARNSSGGLDRLGDSIAAGIVVVSPFSVLTAQAIYDIAAVKGAVRKHNRAHMLSPLTVGPIYFPDSHACGLQAHLQF